VEHSGRQAPVPLHGPPRVYDQLKRTNPILLASAADH
jgi:hypothetical protein